MQSPCSLPTAALRPRRPFVRRQRRFVLIAAILASALGFIDGSVVSIAIPAIRADLGATLADAQWISTPTAHPFGADPGRRRRRRQFRPAPDLLAGIVLFIAASAACAAAAPRLLIAARPQGIGAAIMVPGSLAIIAKAYPKRAGQGDRHLGGLVRLAMASVR